MAQSEQDRRIALAADHFRHVLIGKACDAVENETVSRVNALYMARDVLEERAVNTGLIELQRALQKEERYVDAALHYLQRLVDLAQDVMRDEGASESTRGSAREIMDYIVWRSDNTPS